MFPIMLCATRLSGVGADMLFIGLIRRLPPAISDGRAVVRFWTNGSGIILCCERGTADSFGLDAFELVGQPFSNLCTDVEGVNRCDIDVVSHQAAHNHAGNIPHVSNAGHAVPLITCCLSGCTTCLTWHWHQHRRTMCSLMISC